MNSSHAPDRDTGYYVPFDDAERAKIREQIRDAIHERRLKARVIFAEQHYTSRGNALDRSSDYGKIFVRTIFLLHGGAIVAILTLVGALFGKSEHNVLVAVNFARHASSALMCFAAGLVISGLIAAIGYLNWMYVYDSHLSERLLYDFVDGKEVSPDPRNQKQINFSYYLAIFFAVISILLFLYGCWRISDALIVMGAI